MTSPEPPRFNRPPRTAGGRPPPPPPRGAGSRARPRSRIKLHNRPKLAGQSQLREHRPRLVRRPSPPLRLRARLSVPRLRQPPALIQRQRSAARHSPRRAPLIHVLFRPEVEDRSSREDDVVPPLAHRTCEMYESFADHGPVFDAHVDGVSAVGAALVDVGIGMQDGGDAEGVPHAVGEGVNSVGAHGECGRHCRIRHRHQDLARVALQDDHVRAGEPLERREYVVLGSAQNLCNIAGQRRRAATHGHVVDHTADFAVVHTLMLISPATKEAIVKSKDVKKAAVKAAKTTKKAAADLYEKAVDAAEPAVKAIAKAAKPKVKAVKKAARGMAKDALMAGSKKLKKAAKAI